MRLVLTFFIFLLCIISFIISATIMKRYGPFYAPGMIEFISRALISLVTLLTFLIPIVLAILGCKMAKQCKTGIYLINKKRDLQILSTLLLTFCLLILTSFIFINIKQNTVNNAPPEPEPTFVCQYQKDNSPPLSAESTVYFDKARKQQRGAPYLPAEDWQAIEQNYLKAVELGNWKAMNNLALLYVKGAYSKEDLQTDRVLKGLPPMGIQRDRAKAIALYEKMIEMKLPLGYYNWYAAIRDGVIPNAAKGEAGKALFEAARLGNPTAQAIIGNGYAFGRPREKQRDDIAELYFRCAGAQDDAEALMEVAGFYDVAKKNKPRALFYYQKAASLGHRNALNFLHGAFEEDPTAVYDFGYQADPELAKIYDKLYYQVRENPGMTLPNLMKDYPLPRHPTQGYDADNPDVRPE